MAAPSVVLVEDDPRERAARRAAFEEAGYRVVAEASTQIGTAPLVARRRPSVVVLPMLERSPRRFRELRELREAFPATHVVVLAANDDERYEAFLHRLGATLVVKEDVSADRLVQLVEALRLRSPPPLPRLLEADEARIA